MKLINYSKYSEVQKLIWQIIIEIGDNCNGMLILLCNILQLNIIYSEMLYLVSALVIFFFEFFWIQRPASSVSNY